MVAQGRTLKLSDIATVTRGYEDPSTFMIRNGGEPALLLGIVLVVNLRMLGIGRNLSFAALHRLLPWGILGFSINSITGMLFFIATPEQYTQNVAFHWKMVLLLLAGVNVLYFTVFDEPWALQAGDDAPLASKVIAASAIFLWVGVIYCGRMLPFIGNSF